MELPTVWWVILLSVAGLAVGLGALAKGMVAYRATLRVGDIGTSTISSIAAGEVRVTGVVEPAELTLVSLLTSTPCVYYRASVGAEGDGSPVDDGGFEEERSVGFRVRDATGSIRVFPRGAHIDAPVRLDEETGAMGDEPPGLAFRAGASMMATEPDREAAIAALLRLHDPSTSDRPGALRPSERGRRYREARLEPGDAVTVVGRALPFGDLSDPVAADFGSGADLRADDPEVAADLAAAREAGILALDPAAAWGNAAIAGFGIGRPVSTPIIEAGATPLPVASAEETERIKRTFEIAPEALVLVASSEVPLLIAHGAPGAVVERSRLNMALGLLGAVLAIASAMVFAVLIGNELGL
jgi:hypothetical protein